MGRVRSLTDLLAQARACRLCDADLPLGARPVLRASVTSRILIVGQAPGTKVHETGIPWNDASGDRLRDWMGLSRDAFYDESRIAIVPMGLCYPGRDPKGGDLPPVKACAPLWHPVTRSLLPDLELTLLVGGYAQSFYLGDRAQRTMTETVRQWRDYGGADDGPAIIPLPHPSWRNTAWIKRHPWFEAEILPALKTRVAALMA